ncbi:MAG TPA: hypothetical protein DDZ78_01940, partial [Porphyromonadaceae bacterium]|nr:hypothetical protein [Porphyromonadaceae bacterium]
MKVPSLIYKAVCISFFVMLAFACNDNLEKIGFSIQPDGEGLAMNVDTLTLSAETVQVDSIFSRTKYPVLGEYVDPVFGSIKSDYMGEFYLPEGIGFHDDVRAIDSVRLLVSYTSIIGDSLSPMQVLVYGLN